MVYGTLPYDKIASLNSGSSCHFFQTSVAHLQGEVRVGCFRTRCLAITGKFPAPSGCKSSEDVVFHQSRGQRWVSSNYVSLANHLSHRSFIQRKGVHCRSPLCGIAPACLHSRCDQPPQKGCRGSRHRSPHCEQKTPRR